jgi:predicted naringenin-chalcone synthase
MRDGMISDPPGKQRSVGVMVPELDGQVREDLPGQFGRGCVAMAGLGCMAARNHMTVLQTIDISLKARAMPDRFKPRQVTVATN